MTAMCAFLTHVPGKDLAFRTFLIKAENASLSLSFHSCGKETWLPRWLPLLSPPGFELDFAHGALHLLQNELASPTELLVHVNHEFFQRV